MASSIASAAVSAIPVIGNIASGIIDANNASEANAKNRQWQLEDRNWQWQANFDNWNRQNEYNDPKNARKRLEAAGYNANMMTGQIGTGNLAAAIQPASSGQRAPTAIPRAPDIGGGLGSSLQAYQSMRMTDAQVDSLKSQNEARQSENLLRAFEMGLKNAQRDNVKQDTVLKEFQGIKADSDSNYTRQKMANESKLFPYQLEGQQAHNSNLIAENAIMKNRDNREAARLAIDAKQAASHILRNMIMNSKDSVEIEKIKTGLREMESTFYDPARNDNSLYYYNQVGKLVNSALTGFAAGGAAAGASRMFKGNSSIPKPTTRFTESFDGAGNLKGSTYSRSH